MALSIVIHSETSMLKGKTALVTGSTSGIGLGIAQALARQGANVVLNGFGDAKAHGRGARSRQGPWGAGGYHGADMSKAADIEAMMKYAATTFGRVDILVNNAGIQHVAAVQDFPVEKWDAIIAINLTSAFHTTRLALPAMQQANWGRIINVASVHGLVGSAQKSAYVAAKHGIVGLTKVTALENATTGVTCNAICPGWVLTPLVQKQVDAKAAAQGISNEEATGSCWARKSPRCSSPRPKSWASWPCSSARPPPTMCAAWPGTWTAAGRPSKPRRCGRKAKNGHRAPLQKSPWQLPGAFCWPSLEPPRGAAGLLHLRPRPALPPGLAGFHRQRGTSAPSAAMEDFIMAPAIWDACRLRCSPRPRAGVAGKAERLGQAGGLGRNWSMACWASPSTLARPSADRPKAWPTCMPCTLAAVLVMRRSRALQHQLAAPASRRSCRPCWWRGKTRSRWCALPCRRAAPGRTVAMPHPPPAAAGLHGGGIAALFRGGQGQHQQSCATSTLPAADSCTTFCGGAITAVWACAAVAAAPHTMAAAARAWV
jgi:3-hydroxybutyrate dehydrogenase